MTKLVMGSIGSPSLSIEAMHENAELGENRTKYPIAYYTLKINSFVACTYTY